MTTHIPHLTIPHAIFANAAASILLPIGLGTGVAFTSSPAAALRPETQHALTRAGNHEDQTTARQQTQETYKLMKQPPLRPPPYVFGPVWTVLYGLMGYAAHRAVTIGLSPLTSTVDGVRTAKHAATLYTIQLALNLAWTPLFFNLRKPALALADIVALLGVNGYLTHLYFKIDRIAGWAMVPYLAWLSFATYLNAGVGYLNDWKISDEDLLKKAD